MKKICFTWNGWHYVVGKKSYWKERHNPALKNNREKVIITSQEFSEAAKKWKEVFR